MTETNPKFVEFILGLQQGAWMALGKIQNPFTGQSDVDLRHGKAIIDTLEMLLEIGRAHV